MVENEFYRFSCPKLAFVIIVVMVVGSLFCLDNTIPFYIILNVISFNNDLDIYICNAITGSIPLLGGLSVPDGIICPVVSGFGTDMVYHIFFYRNLQFTNHVIIIKTKVLLPQAWVTLVDFGYPVFGPLVFLPPKTYIIWL